MKHFFVYVLLGLGMLITVPSLYAQSMREDALLQAEAITFEEFYSHLSVLADDSLQGRDVASPGMQKSGAYIVKLLDEYGLQPAGEKGSYFQAVPMVKTELIPGREDFHYQQGEKSVEFVYGNNFSLLPYKDQELVNKDLEVVFVGDGIVVPERGIDAYKGLDVEGKIILVQLTMPKEYKKDSLARACSQIEKRLEEARTKRVEGIIFYIPLGPLQKIILTALHEQIAMQYYYLDADNTQQMFFDIGVPFLGMTTTKQVKKMFKLDGKSFRKAKKSVKKGCYESYEMAGDFQVKYEADLLDKTCRNIIALLPGSDPELKDEYVVLTAHLDHIGIGRPVKGDSIYNGAWDNASGSSGILTIAGAFSRLPEAPKRSVLFVWFTGEEKGLLGSNYFVTHPTVDKEAIKVCVNQDMLGNLFDSDEFITMGYGMSNASEAIDFAGETLGMTRDSASDIQNRYFQNSDHYSFVKDSIPGILFWGGLKPVGEDKRSEKTYMKWEKKHLHKPDDDLNQDFCEEAMIKGMRLGFLSAWYLANEMDEISWDTENEDYQRYVGKEE